jgi:hypothetical protein
MGAGASFRVKVAQSARRLQPFEADEFRLAAALVWLAPQAAGALVLRSTTMMMGQSADCNPATAR